MKILQIINSLGTGGAEKLLLETIPLYRKAGLEMDVLLLWDDHHPFTQQLKELDICRVFILNESSKVRDIYNPLNIFKMRHIMKDYPVVHVHLFPAQYFAVLANQLNGNLSRLIFTEHNTSNTRIEKSYYKPVEQWFYRRYATLVSISEEIKQIYEKYLEGLPITHHMIHNGVDVSRYSSASQVDWTSLNVGISSGDRIIIQVSAFRPQKDQDTLIKAMKLLPKSFKLLLVGAGERYALLEDMVQSLGLVDQVIFLGQRMDIPQLLKSADVVVLSSHYEGLSLSSVEGMASGRPFIASDVPGLREVVKDAGLLFPQGDAQTLSGMILKLADDPIYAEQIAKRGIERAKQYDINKMTEEHIALYKSLYPSI